MVDGAASAADAGAAGRQLHGPSVVAEVHVEIHPYGLGRGVLPFPFPFPVAYLEDLLETRQVLMVEEVHLVLRESVEHQQLGQWAQIVGLEVAGGLFVHCASWLGLLTFVPPGLHDAPPCRLSCKRIAR